MGKRKADSASEDEVPEEVPSEDEEVEKKKKPRAKAKPKRTEPFVSEQGWNVVPPSLIWRDFDTEASTKIAAFDLDGTLVNPKGKTTFARSADDYKFWNKKVVKTIQGFHDDGYKIVIFTNQGGIKTALEGKAAATQESRCANVVGELGVPAQVFMAPSMAEGDTCRKPATGMWDFMSSNCNDEIKPDLKASFYVGDAAGRDGDHGDSDKAFAAAIGIKFNTPEEVFGDMDGKKSLAGTAMPKIADMNRDAGVGEGEKAEGGGGSITGPNAEIIKLFMVAADIAKKSGEDKAHFKANALAKAGQALTTFPEKITLDNLKAVGKLQGVGKGSLEKIKEYLETGKMAAAQGTAAKPEAPPTKAQELASNFM